MTRSPIDLNPVQRRQLEQMTATPASLRQRQRAQIVLSASEGRKDREIAAELGVTISTVRLWRHRFEQRGLAGLTDLPRSGRRSVFATQSANSPTEPEAQPVPTRSARNGSQPVAPGLPTTGSGADSELALLAKPSREPGSDIILDGLLEAAGRTISRLGFASTRVSDIAAEAGVSPAAVHYYFSTKDEILARALLWANARHVIQLEEATTAGTPVERLANFIARSIPYPGAQRDEYLLEIDLWSRIRTQPELLGIWEGYNERWTAHLKAVLEDGARDGSFTLSAPADEVAERLVSMTDGLSAQAAIGSRHMPCQRVLQLVTRFAAEQVGLPADELRVTE